MIRIREPEHRVYVFSRLRDMASGEEIGVEHHYAVVEYVDEGADWQCRGFHCEVSKALFEALFINSTIMEQRQFNIGESILQDKVIFRNG